MSDETAPDLPYVVNPEAIGDPDISPVVYVPADLVTYFNPCACGGVNGFHRDDCENAKP